MKVEISIPEVIDIFKEIKTNQYEYQLYDQKK